MGAQLCQNSLIYHASSANTCLFLFSSYMTSHPSTKTWVHKFRRGRNYRLSTVRYDIWAEQKTSWRTRSLTNPGCHWPTAEPCTTAKSPHSDWTHRNEGPFNAKHRWMFYSTKRVVNHCTVSSSKKDGNGILSFIFLLYFLRLGRNSCYHFRGNLGHRKVRSFYVFCTYTTI